MDTLNKFCILCKKKVSENTTKCECGNTKFIIGNLLVKDKTLMCKCTSSQFITYLQIEYRDRISADIKCTKCNKKYKAVFYKANPNFTFWN